MPDYSKGKIYKLYHGEMFYYGSTTSEYLCQRLGKHHGEIKRGNTSKLYTYLNDKDWNDVSIILVESVNCNSKDELRARETFWILKELKNSLCLNTKVAVADDLSRSLIYQKMLINQKQKVMCECGIEIAKGAKARHIKSNQHTEALNLPFIKADIKPKEQCQKQYDRMKEKVICSCGTELSRSSLYLHLKNIKH